MILIFLSSGLFLGWSLGANDAANVFGTAVGTRMVKFRTAALICSVFLLLGAVIGGSGASHTLGKLGAVNEIAGAFIVALAAGFTVFMMTKFELPVSTSQAIVGAIIGWNFYSGNLTDPYSLTKIVGSWIMCPILAAFFSFVIFNLVKWLLTISKLHLFEVDALTRTGLIVVGAFGSYSLGANNIANVMGVFVPASPFHNVKLFDLLNLTGTQQLFFLGAIAIGVGVYTYSYKVMTTVGGGLMKLTPVAALITVLSQALVLFLFASVALENWLVTHGLPAIPLVPVSSSQAVVGSIIGIGIATRNKSINYRIMGRISLGWLTTPIIAGVITFFMLFFMQNVFAQKVFHPVQFMLSHEVASELKARGLTDHRYDRVTGNLYESAYQFKKAVAQSGLDQSKQWKTLVKLCEIYPMLIDFDDRGRHLSREWFSKGQLAALSYLSGHLFTHKWQLQKALEELCDEWKLKEKTRINKLYNKNLQAKYSAVFHTFELKETARYTSGSSMVDRN